MRHAPPAALLMTLIARQQSVLGLRARLQDLVLGPLQPLESGGPWKASRRDETSFFATASKEPIGSAASATKPGHRSLDWAAQAGHVASSCYRPYTWVG